MYSPNQLYDYLRYYHHTNKKNTIVRNFKDGSVNPLDLFRFQDNCNNPYVDNNCNNNISVQKFNGFIDMYDQEPIDTHQSKLEFKNSVLEGTACTKTPEIINLDDYDFITAISASMHLPIICHSEKNSQSIDILTNQKNFLEVHYWCHAMISLFWFSEFKFHQKINVKSKKRFGTYIRDFTKTRSYRKQLLINLSKISNSVYYKYPKNLKNSHNSFLNKWEPNNQQITAKSSAFIHWPDHTKFDIQIVAETLFETNKIHLTEKVFKPIVMYQPFILFAGPNSLKYIRNYGFETFGDLWDESYDLETNSDKRFTKIIKLIENLNNLSSTNYNKLMLNAQRITNRNRKLFFSEKFNKRVMNELFTNLDNATHQQKEMFKEKPGGTLFETTQAIYQNLGTIPDFYKNIMFENLKFCDYNFPEVSKQIIKKYNHLL